MPIPETPNHAQLPELRSRGPVSSAIADIQEDARLDDIGKRHARYRAKGEALAAVNVTKVRVGKRTVTVSDPHVDEHGRFGVTLTHPDFPADWDTPFYFTNPPIMARTGRVVGGVEEVTEDPALALRQMIADTLTLVLPDG